MKKTIIATIFVIVLFGKSQCQTALASKSINTTDPPNLSWVVGEFEIIKAEGGEAIIAPIKQPLMPSKVTVRYSNALKSQYPWFEPTRKLVLVIREGWVSQVFIKQ